MSHTQKHETIFRRDESKHLSGRVAAVTQWPRENPGEKQPGCGRCCMVAKLIDVLFGCWHSRYSFPVTIRGTARRPQAGALTGTYVVCLDCGREFPYDWQEMKVITSSSERREYVASIATREAA
jgi:hypothetical protein